MDAYIGIITFGSIATIGFLARYTGIFGKRTNGGKLAR